MHLSISDLLLFVLVEMNCFSEGGGDDGGGQAERGVLVAALTVDVFDQHVHVAEVTVSRELQKLEKVLLMLK